MTWLINNQDPAELNLSGFLLRIITQAPDTLTFTQAAPYDADPVYDYGAAVTIRRDGAQWFKGTCTNISRIGSGASERIQYQISGPWWQLQKVTYRQEYARFVGGVAAAINLSKLIIGTDSAGARVTSGQVITAAVNYASTQLGTDAQFQLGTVAVATQVPFEELNALACADVITRVLRWNPNVVAYFDYSTDIPTLNFAPRASLTALNIAHSDAIITDNSINPRHDLQLDGVVVQYERNDTYDGNEQKNIITDTAGDTSNPLKTLNLFFDLQGSSVSYVRQKVVTSAIRATSATWWKKRHPKLQAATAVTVANGTTTAVDDEEENDGTAYTKELISGSIADWMGGVGANAQIIKADVTYTPPGGTAKTETIRLQVQGTNANDKTYTTIGDASPAEPTPDGLAAAIHASFSTLQYDGTLTLKEAEAGNISHISRTLNVTGGRSEWASMAAQIYIVVYDLDAGSTQIQFGAAKHLGATDLFQLLRNTRTRKGAIGAQRASTGGGGSNDLPTKSPNTTTADDGGSGTAPFTASINADGELTIAAGHYLVVNTATYLDTTEPAAGDYAYLQIKHSSAGVLDATTPVALEVSASPGLATTTLDIDDTYIEYSNILLAEVIGDGDETPYTVAQYRSGNCELVLSFTNGKYHYTAAFEGGSA